MTSEIPAFEANLEHISAEMFANRFDEILDMVTTEGISLMIDYRGRSCLLVPSSDPPQPCQPYSKENTEFVLEHSKKEIESDLRNA